MPEILGHNILYHESDRYWKQTRSAYLCRDVLIKPPQNFSACIWVLIFRKSFFQMAMLGRRLFVPQHFESYRDNYWPSLRDEQHVEIQTYVCSSSNFISDSTNT